MEITLYYEDFTEKRERTSILSEHEYEYDHERAKVTVMFTSKRLDIQRSSILDRIGKLKGILKTAVDVGGAYGKKFEEQNQENGDMLDLLTGMSEVVQYTFDIDQFATVAQLKTVIDEAEAVMQEATDLIFKHDDGSNPEEILSILRPEDQTKIQELKLKIARFQQKFDRGVTRSAENVEIIKARFENLESKQEEYTYLRKLAPHRTKLDPPRYLEGTREDILATIIEWTNYSDAPNIIWIRGYPGTGKSAIAFALAAELERSHRMGAIFAFDRKYETNPSVLWRHFAFCLAREYPNCRDHVVATLKRNPSVFTNMTATEIFHQFVADPLQQWDASFANIPRGRLPVLVIDALDECGGLDGPSSQARKDVLSHVAEWATLSSCFKLIITSRVEDDIDHTFTNIRHLTLHIGTGVSSESSQDIQRYIEYRFDKIVKANLGLPSNWPAKDVVDSLTSRASGMFIWAATALNYIEDVPGDDRLDDIQGGTLPPGDVHALYRQVLTKSSSKWRPQEHANFVDLVGAIVVTRMSLTAAEFARLLDMKETAVVNICNMLRPVLANGDPIRFSHQSFVDFLLGHTDRSATDPVNDELSCPETFRIDPAVAHRRLTESMFQLMNKSLRFNICDIESSFVRNAVLPRSQVEKAIDRPLSYACRFWGFHVEQTRHGTNLASSNVTVFLREKLLFWLEALGVLGAVNVAAAALTCLGAKLPVLGHTEQAVEEDLNIVKDAIKFVQYFAPAIAKSAPHIYMSCLPFAPRSSTVANLYGPRFGSAMSLQRGKLQNWPVKQTVIRGHNTIVTRVAFSHDGKRIVSSSLDKTIRMWDAETGQTVAGPFNGHTDEVTSVAFSPDGKRVVSGSSDETIRVWDVEIGRTTVAGPFNGHTDCVNFVAFSPDGKRVVSGSDDKTIRIWDVETAQTMAGLFNGQENQIPHAQGPHHPFRSIFTHQSVLDEHGWMKDPAGQLLFWVPSLHRLSLHRPSNVTVCGRNETRLDVSKAVFGYDWGVLGAP
ncbi:hypothetical protein OBBRIDRAFT_31370 [Obba rivulosa]|uniref:Nephrocystin 3-like N-terminal domain-containing protein n=1 Tax=Obba rivulosa TaxID=1052685 RepID=A0A8E2AQU8_9APHY|nr:hypothetical protein OBBRIDRAFT_31370 [Obba rivulosa]